LNTIKQNSENDCGMACLRMITGLPEYIIAGELGFHPSNKLNNTDEDYALLFEEIAYYLHGKGYFIHTIYSRDILFLHNQTGDAVNDVNMKYRIIDFGYLPSPTNLKTILLDFKLPAFVTVDTLKNPLNSFHLVVYDPEIKAIRDPALKKLDFLGVDNYLIYAIHLILDYKNVNR